MHKLLRYPLALGAIFVLAHTASGQATGGVGIGTATPDASALLDLTSGSKGLLAPRMTAAQRTAIQSPAQGLLVYQTDGVQPGFWYYSGTAWAVLGAPGAGDNLGNHTATQNLNLSGNSLLNPNRLDLLAGADNSGANDPGAVAFQYRAGGYRHWLRSRHNSGLQDGNALDFFLNNSGSAAGSSAPGTGNIPVLTLSNNNSLPRVGIGTSSPQASLHVVGSSSSTTSANIAPLASITASGPPASTGLEPENLLDGVANASNAWAVAGNLPIWVQLDFGPTPRTIGRYGVYGYNDPARATQWKLQGSQNASSWTDLHTVTIAPAANQYAYYNFSNTTAYRYYRLYITANAGNLRGVTLNEWQMMEVLTTYATPTLQVDGSFVLGSGPAVTGVSTDTDLGSNSDGQLPTQRAVRTYVNAKAAAAADNLGNHTATQNLDLAANQLVGNGGTSGLNISSDGNVGIGTANPTALLHVAGAARIEGLASSGARMVTADNSGNLGTQVLPTDAQQLSIAGSIISLTNGGTVTLPAGADNLGNHTATQNLNLAANQLVGNGGSSGLTISSGGNVGIGTPTPQGRFDVATGAVRLPGGGSGDTWFNYASDNKNYLRGTSVLADQGGNVGIGTSTPTQKLDVTGNANVTGNLTTGGNATVTGNLATSGNASVSGVLGFGNSTRQMLNLWGTNYGIGIQNNTQYFRSDESFAWYTGGTHNNGQFNAGGGTTPMVLKAGRLGIGTISPTAALDVPTGSVHLPNDSWINYAGDNKNYLRGTTILADDAQGGYVGIGTANPSYPLDVQGSAMSGNFAYGYLNGSGSVGYSGNNAGPVSIRANGRVVATEFNATSDRRLKNVIGLSNAAADLALLTKLRITDYTMRDRVQYGNRQFKKVIAQEVEQVFPQAVNQHSGFLPDVYVNAVNATAQADSLLVLTLPAAPATAAHAGQRLKLISAAGEVVATVKATSGATLTVRGARQLAGQQVFVFGLEHADVRTVDYEALAMLNVSATQELARQLAELQKQNASLRQQNKQQQQALHTLQTETTASTASLAERLKALENLLGAKAEAISLH